MRTHLGPDKTSEYASLDSSSRGGRAGFPGLPGFDGSRRRLLRRSLGAAPILMTLVSRPAFGGMQCVTPSGFVSMPTSQHGTPTYCSGRTPGYWKTHVDWPSPYCAKTVWGKCDATLFQTYFQPLPGTCPVGTNWSTVTFLQVLSPTVYTTSAGAPFDVARLLVASLLNVAAHWVPVLSAQRVRDIWTEYMTKGYFEPTAGVQWGHDQIVQYIKSTMPL